MSVRDRSNRSGFELHCDQHTCSAVFRSRGGTFDVLKLQRLAHRQGWTTRQPSPPYSYHELDLCPAHGAVEKND